MSRTQRRTKGRAAALLIALLPGIAGAFGEEHGSDIDSAEHVSTHHLYLTRALAVCAGFASNGKPDPLASPQAAERIAIADQLADSERLHHGTTHVSQCSGRPYAMPTAASLGCPAGSGNASVMPVIGSANIAGLAPVPAWRPEEGCFTSRFGPYSNDFHFPDAARVAVLRDWAFGKSARLDGTARFSFGGWFATPWSAGCNVARAEFIDTGAIAAGSLEALGIYLHALGDFHSHAQCLAHWGERRSPPWPTHTISTAQTGCAFIDHARELGCPADDAHDSLLLPAPGDVYVEHAVAAALAIAGELAQYARQQGIAPRLGEGAVQRAWLERHARRFVSGWPWLGGAAERRAFANALAVHCATLSPGQVPPEIPRQAGESACAVRR